MEIAGTPIDFVVGTIKAHSLARPSLLQSYSPAFRNGGLANSIGIVRRATVQKSAQIFGGFTKSAYICAEIT